MPRAVRPARRPPPRPRGPAGPAAGPHREPVGRPRLPRQAGAHVVILYHYTCRHAARRIARSGLLVPAPQRVLVPSGALSLTWLTDLEVPDKHLLGLESVRSPCDRTEVRLTA